MKDGFLVVLKAEYSSGPWLNPNPGCTLAAQLLIQVNTYPTGLLRKTTMMHLVCFVFNLHFFFIIH
jgi:hypothetical protein